MPTAVATMPCPGPHGTALRDVPHPGSIAERLLLTLSCKVGSMMKTTSRLPSLGLPLVLGTFLGLFGVLLFIAAVVAAAAACERCGGGKSQAQGY